MIIVLLQIGFKRIFTDFLFNFVYLQKFLYLKGFIISHSLEFYFFININILFCFNADTWLGRTYHVLARGVNTDVVFLPTVPIHHLTIWSVTCCYVPNCHKPNGLK